MPAKTWMTVTVVAQACRHPFVAHMSEQSRRGLTVSGVNRNDQRREGGSGT